MDENDFDLLPLKPIEKRRFLERVSMLKVVLCQPQKCYRIGTGCAVPAVTPHFKHLAFKLLLSA